MTSSSVVNLSELEALMTDLADSPAPTPSKPPAQRAAVVSASFDKPPVAGTLNCLNFLMFDLPLAAKPVKPRSTVVSTSFEADDLDSIMNALNGGDSGGSSLNVHVELAGHGHRNGHGHGHGHEHGGHEHEHGEHGHGHVHGHGQGHENFANAHSNYADVIDDLLDDLPSEYYHSAPSHSAQYLLLLSIISPNLFSYI